jgi:hypothetical protein
MISLTAAEYSGPDSGSGVVVWQLWMSKDRKSVAMEMVLKFFMWIVV